MYGVPGIVFPIDFKAQETDIELPRLHLIEYSKDWCRLSKTHTPDLLNLEIEEHIPNFYTF